MQRASAVLLLLLLTSCRNDLGKMKHALGTQMLNTEYADSVTIYYTKEGHTKAELFTRQFVHVTDTKPAYIEMKNGLKVVFYNDSMQTQSTLTARYGRYFEENGNVLVRDSVRVWNMKQEELQTEELVWNEKLQKFYTNKFVKISTPRQVIYGDGLESNQTFSDYSILKVKGIIGVSKQALPEVQ
ncbi:MAG TPA: LPS export ABC transporter periplasmic protein LptC [Chitinophagaceae bacterium]|nr:LPS export ABC transporter periplasmic protein LptC [Chitinophagaceae bacterium]HNF72827.1 LPS export ABC transporter periplasmic protein LptC [Chitinophagaceae bacterium]